MMHLTIQEFSKKTGLAPSTLRFYDRKNLLKPESRLDNGYRAYAEEQIPDAVMIHSLRCADIQISDIADYLQADEAVKKELIAKWRDEISSKLYSLRIAQKYIDGLGPKEKHIHLTKWEEQTTFIWFRHTVERKIHPFKEAMIQDLETLKDWGMKGSSHIFVRTLDSKDSVMLGEVGFIIDPKKIPFPQQLIVNEVYIETVEPTLFATMECSVEDLFLCFYFIQLIRQYGLKPQGIKLERFDSPDDTVFTYLIPLLKMNE